MSNILRVLKIIYLFFKYDIDKSLIRSNIIGNKKYLFFLLPWNILTYRKSINLAENIKLTMLGRSCVPNSELNLF